MFQEDAEQREYELELARYEQDKRDKGLDCSFNPPLHSDWMPEDENGNAL